MSIVTLLTDFGIQDAYVGTVKGVVLSINPEAKIIDITHQIEPQNLVRAAYIISSYYKYFPAGTVHMIIVDPGVGSDRAILAVKTMGHFFLAPDNGVLTTLLDEDDIDVIVRVENTRLFLHPVSRTFHGRDVFAPVGAQLSKGIDIEILGPKINSKDALRLQLEKPHFSKHGELVGAIVGVDRFGNCITNIDESALEALCRKDSFMRLEFDICGKRIKGLSRSYDQAKPQHPLAVVGGFGYLEIALNGGNAKNYLNAQIGDRIRVAIKS
jgi:S-adenosylmethionine hydrolase